MKVISFFSRVAIICNVAFVAFVIFQKMETQHATAGKKDILAPVPFVKDIIITLGIAAIIVNLIMCIVYTIIVIAGKKKILQKWMVLINISFLLVQIFYFFLRKT